MVNTKKLLLQKIFELITEINYRTKATVFFSYSPHVDSITIDTHIKGWIRGSEPDAKHHIYCDELEQLDMEIDYLETVKQEAEKI